MLNCSNENCPIQHQSQTTYICPNTKCYYDQCHEYFQRCNRLPPSINKPSLDYTVSVPINLAKSLEGKYYVGYADNLTFGKGTSAWARLYNPTNSGVNLHVTVWTVTDISEAPFRAQIWFNTNPPGIPQESMLVTPANLALYPLPKPKIKLHYATNVEGDPSGGIKAFVRRGQPETTLVDDEQGKFIFPPGGSFLIFLSSPEAPDLVASGRISFGWWEEPICQ